MRPSPRDLRTPWHGNIFEPQSGSMFIHVRRESGLAHRSLVLRPWQVQVLRIITSKWVLVALAVGMASWGYFAVQAARVPFLKLRVTQLEREGRRLDTLERTLSELQARYVQVQRLMSTPGRATAATSAPGSARAASSRDSLERRVP